MRQIHRKAAVAAFAAATAAALAAPVTATALSPAADSRWTRIVTAGADGLMHHDMSWGTLAQLMHHDLNWNNAGPVIAHMMHWDIDWTPGLLSDGSNWSTLVTDGTNWDGITPADMHYYNATP
ncbi:hypothetical protein [Actinoplanes sp. RD1]|uniref:hypothetical protein n=1 Tax=Actinoplanes sp. RD1 TaxID=3064538 RepID=UPI002741AF8D|nr:hypothetical protein [Actinoplanes sp. RD1]